MRDILFRGKDIEHNMWHFGLLRKNLNGSIFISEPICNNKIKHCAIFSDTIGQYTGIKDKNGVKIFEGDIIKHERKDNFKEYNIGEVVYHSNTCEYLVYYFKKVPKNITHLWMTEYKGVNRTLGNLCYWDCEVIGNIHDNPKMKGSK